MVPRCLFFVEETDKTLRGRSGRTDRHGESTSRGPNDKEPWKQLWI